jgi:CrcB protein
VKAVLAVAIGAVIGAGLRYGIISATSVDQIWSTLFVNLIGCFALGLVLVHGERYLKPIPILQPVWRPFLATGLLGGFTTTSAFAVQSVELLQQANQIQFLILFSSSILGGLLAFHLAQKIAVKGLAQ